MNNDEMGKVLLFRRPATPLEKCACGWRLPPFVLFNLNNAYVIASPDASIVIAVRCADCHATYSYTKELT